MIDKKSALQTLVLEKGRPALRTAAALRLLTSIKRHKAMMQVYQTSLNALEATQQNLEMQQITAEVQQLIGRAGRADIEDIEEHVNHWEDMQMERQELAQLMSTNGDNDDDFIDELNLTFPDEGAIKPVLSPMLQHSMPTPPSYIAQQNTPPDPIATETSKVSNTASNAAF